MPPGLEVGGSVPTADVFSMIDGKPTKLCTDSIFTGKTVALFAVPGALTPG